MPPNRTADPTQPANRDALVKHSSEKLPGDNKANTMMKSTQNYWDTRYAAGGTSGVGSINLLRAWKWMIINRYCQDWQDRSLIDVGCGDRSFWSGRDFPRAYTGVDFSDVIIKQHQAAWGHRSNINFIRSGAETKQEISAEIVFCFDMLFHVLDEDTYVSILRNLCCYSTGIIFVFTWLGNPFRDPRWLAPFVRQLHISRALHYWRTSADDYQKYRDFTKYLPVFDTAGFELIGIESPYIIDPYGAMLVFKK